MNNYDNVPNYNNNYYVDNNNIKLQNLNNNKSVNIINGEHYNFRGRNMELSNDPLSVLSQSGSCTVVQTIEMLEILAGYETKNRYNVFVKTLQGNSIFLFQCKEDSDYCTRYYCKGDSRPFKMLVNHVNSSNPNQKFGEGNLYCVFDRPFKCTCLCFQRPKVTCYLNHNNIKVGEITEPCTCCSPHFNINSFDKIDKTFQIHSSCCQCGLICKDNICGACSDVKFPIYRGNTSSYNDSNQIGLINKVSRDIATEIISDADTFEISFPSDSSPEDKLLIIGTTLLIDYRYFEMNPMENNQQ